MKRRHDARHLHRHHALDCGRTAQLEQKAKEAMRRGYVTAAPRSRLVHGAERPVILGIFWPQFHKKSLKKAVARFKIEWGFWA